MKIIVENMMTKDMLSLENIMKVVCSDKFRNYIHKLYNIKDCDPFTSGINAIAVSTDICEAINIVNNKQSVIAKPYTTSVQVIESSIPMFTNLAMKYNPLENIIFEVADRGYNITVADYGFSIDKRLSENVTPNRNIIDITPSDKFYEVRDYIKSNLLV